MTNVHVYSCRYLEILSAVGVVQTTVQVFVGRASFERKCRRSERIDELGHVLSLVLGYWESLVVDLSAIGFSKDFSIHEYIA